MDYTALNSKVTRLVTSLGFPITASRNGLVVGKGNAVISPAKSSLEEGGTQTSLLQINNKTVYLTATSKYIPLVGDLIVAGHGQWLITAIGEIKPSTTAIVWKLEVA